MTKRKRVLCHHTYATVVKTKPTECWKCGGYVTKAHFKRSGYIMTTK
jgi:hypothetical protein